jgi:tetratricopeptide (TPR) repeat protein
MKIAVCSFVVFVVAIVSITAQGKSIEEYIDEARKLGDAGNLEEAIHILEQAVQEYPENADAYAYLGLYTGMSAGRAGDYMEAGRLSMLSFEMLDKAISLDPENVRGYLFRGIMGVKVPKFLGRLDGAINDLMRVVKMHKASPRDVTAETLITAYTMLAEGYGKNDDIENARGALQKIIELAPGTDAATNAKEQMSTLPSPKAPKSDPLSVKPGDSEDMASLKEKIKQDPQNAALILKLAEAYYDAGQFEEAEKVCQKYVGIDASNPKAYKLLALSVARVAEKGYDERIAEDTNYMTGIAFESMNYMDRAVTLAPEDTELRLMRGIFGIMFPFFVGKHDQAVKDLELVVKSDAPESVKAEALYYLGVARQREAMRYWIEVATKYPQSEASRMVYNEMRPEVKDFDPAAHEKPVVAIDFVLGFQDELAPQTAVWIEDGDGNYMKTIYVSGFSGYAKDKQINLPVWSEMSKFKDVEAVTSASIDVGHHIYIWDVKDSGGKKVSTGAYTIKVEVSYWPSMKYQLAEATVKVGKKEDRVIVDEGDFIPHLKVSYFPK